MAIRLFEPLQLRGVELQNRIVVEPMTQFSANAGVAGDWHLMHLGQFAVSGAALVFTKSTYVGDTRWGASFRSVSVAAAEDDEVLADRRRRALFRGDFDWRADLRSNPCRHGL